MPNLSAFEILAEYLVPGSGIPPEINPFVIQGYWLQVSNTTGAPVMFDLTFHETTGFNSPDDTVSLMAQYFDGTGTLQKPEDFSATNAMFSNVCIANGQTVLLGVQAIPMNLLTKSSVAQTTRNWHGYVSSTVPLDEGLILAATHRLIYLNSDDTTTQPTTINAVVYPVTTARKAII